jgi:hypothetical protein
LLVARRFAVDAVTIEPSRRPHEVALLENAFTTPFVRLSNDKGVVRTVGHLFRRGTGRWRVVPTGNAAGHLEGDSASTGLLWFARPAPGDVRAEVEVLFGDRFRQAGIVACAGRPRAAGLARYTLAIEPREPRPETFLAERVGRFQLVLRRSGTSVATSPLRSDAGGGPRSAKPGGTSVRFTLERRGAHLLCSLGDELRIRWFDPDPLDGDDIGLFITNGRARFDRARIEHLRATRSEFRRVEPDWQPLSGTWLLHTGLTCIPWDHWITGIGAAGGPAYLGCLRAPARDVCVVADVSEASEGFETRTHKHYPLHDVSLSLRARLDAPGTSGYRVLLAPLPGKNVVVLYRDGQEVARAHTFRTVMGSHNHTPRQFTVVARAVGGEITCSIHERVVIRWTDPQPLAAGHVMLGAEAGRVNFANVVIMDVTPRLELRRPPGAPRQPQS